MTVCKFIVNVSRYKSKQNIKRNVHTHTQCLLCVHWLKFITKPQVTQVGFQTKVPRRNTIQTYSSYPSQ